MSLDVAFCIVLTCLVIHFLYRHIDIQIQRQRYTFQQNFEKILKNSTEIHISNFIVSYLQDEIKKKKLKFNKKHSEIADISTSVTFDLEL